jgi:iron complex outermembrane receptor protein
MKDQRFKKKMIVSSIIASCCVFQTTHTYAIEEATDDMQKSNNAKSAGIDVITITVDQRQVDLQDAALSVTSVSSETLSQSNISDVSELNGYVPGLQINKSGGAEIQVNIRGIGSQTPQKFFSQPGVSFHMDGAYVANSIALNMGFLDVDHIEIQRGPQGTAFGAASTGGTMNVISKRPELEEMGAEVEVSLGNYGYTKGKLAVNIPTGETFAIRGVIQATSHDGYSTSNSISGGYELDDTNNVNSRISSLWKPSENLSVSFIAQHYEDDHNGAALKAIDDPNDDPRVVSQDFPAKFDMTMDIYTAIVNWQLPWATLKSTTSYQDMDHAQSFDSDRSDFEKFGGYDHVATWSTTAKTTMQELSLNSVPGGIFDWVVGAFYFKSENGQYVVEYKGTDINDPTEVLPKDTLPQDIPANLYYENLSSIDRTSWAPFLQGTLNVSEDLHITAGVRYNDDDYEGSSSTFYGPLDSTDFSGDNITGKFAIDFAITPENMIYASWSKGYKPGGVNPDSSTALVVSTEIKPEKVTAYEVGSKNRFLDNKLEFNMAAFSYKYQDMQYIEEDPIPFRGGTGNIPSTNILGTELEVNWLLFDDNFILGLNATLLDGEFDDEYYALDRRAADAAGAAAIEAGEAPGIYTFPWFLARGTATVDVRGNTPPNLPKLSGNVNATWNQELSDALLTTRFDIVYRSDLQSRIFNSPNADKVDSYKQINFFIQYEKYNANWRIWLTASNITDEAGISGRFVDPFGSGVVSNEFIAPRQIIANFGYQF